MNRSQRALVTALFAAALILGVSSPAYCATTVEGIAAQYPAAGSAMDQSIDTLGAQGAVQTATVGTFDGGIAGFVDTPYPEPTDSDAYSRGFLPESIVTPGRSGDWTVFSYSFGDIGSRLLGRTEAETSFSTADDSQVVLGAPAADVNSQTFALGNASVEEFLELPESAFSATRSASWKLSIPDGVEVVPSHSDLLFMYHGWQVMRFSAPWAQDTDSGRLARPAVDWDESTKIVTLTVYSNANGMTGDVLLDPYWGGGSGYNPYQTGDYYFKVCNSSGAPSCHLTSGSGQTLEDCNGSASGVPSGWSESASAASKFDCEYTTGTGFRVKLHSGVTSLSQSYLGRWKYTMPNSSVVGYEAVMHGYYDNGGSASIDCGLIGVDTSSAARSQYWTTGGNFSKTLDYINDGDGSHRFNWLGFELKNRSGGTLNGISGSHQCYMAHSTPNANDNYFLLVLVDTSAPPSPTKTSGPSSTAWYGPSNLPPDYVMAASGESGSGLWGGRRNTDAWTANLCDSTESGNNADAALPCSTSGSWTYDNTNSTQGTNSVSFQVMDFGGNTSTNSTYTYKYESTAPLPPGWVADGASGVDIDATSTSTQLAAHWAPVTDQGGSGLAHYDYCISTTLIYSSGVGVSCASSPAPIVSWTTAGTSPNVTATGLSLQANTRYYICVRSLDNAGNYSVMGGIGQRGVCSSGANYVAAAPGAPTNLRDGSASTDLDFTATAQHLDVAFTAPSGTPSNEVGGYDVCFTTSSSGSDCASTALAPWQTFSTAYGYIDSISTSASTVYYSCVRTRGANGQFSTTICSDGTQLDTTAPPAPSTVADGTSTDIDHRATGSSLDANWTAVTDSESGLASYGVCVVKGSDSDDCDSEDASIQWFTALANQTVISGVTLEPNTTYTVCVVAEDNAGNQTETPECSDGVTVSGVRDSSGPIDIDWTASTAQVSATWSTRLDPTYAGDVAHYERCVTTSASGTDCANSAVSPWTSTGVANTATVDASYTNGSVYYLCARAIDSSSNVVGSQCSDGETVDDTTPTTITTVADGTNVNSDLDTTPSTTSAQAAWSGSTDTGSGLLGYDVCLVPQASTCGADNWSLESTATILDDQQTLPLATTMKSCVRAVDVAGNAGTPSCSDGIAVQESVDESTEAASVRGDLGLASDSTTMNSLYDNANTTTDLGTLMTSTESTALNTDLSTIQAVEDVVDSYSAAHPGEFGGSYVNMVTRKVIAKFTANVAAHESAMDQDLTSSQQAKLDAVSSSTTFSAIEAQQDALTTDQAALKARGIDVKQITIDAETSQLAIDTAIGNVTEPEGVTTEQVIEATGDATAVTISQGDTPVDVGCCKADKNSFGKKRKKLDSGIIYTTRGQSTASESNCTTGFQVWGGDGNLYMTTADHCNPSERASYGTGLKWDTGSGRYKYSLKFSRNAWPSREAAKYDAAAIRVIQRYRSGYEYLRWGGADDDVDFTRYVEGGASLHQNDVVCFSGRNTKKYFKFRDAEECGRVVAKSGKKWKVRLAVCSGDSGGAVYKKSLSGILMVGNMLEVTNYEPTTDPWGNEYFVFNCSARVLNGQDQVVGYKRGAIINAWSDTKSALGFSGGTVNNDL